MSFRGVLGVLAKPSYALLALGLAFLFACLVYLVINWGIYGSLLLSPLGFVDKLSVVGLLVQRLFSDMFTTGNGALLLAVSLLQGASFSVMIYTLRRNRKFSAKALGGGGIAAVAAALGLGCVPCGTSIVLPVMTLLFSSSAYAAANIASVVVLVVAFFVTLFSLYTLGGAAAAHGELERVKETKRGE